ncbi:MAG: ADP-ribosylglycohydrolase family protein [Sandaracinus sp.]|nr:ADP-ribosylglycohydrolase family protein [Sandaracinus sp.]
MSRDRLRGCLLGGALADALAFAHEGRAPGPAPELRVGAISDDTQLTLAACEALIADRGEVRPERVAEHLVLWHRRHGFVGLGASTAKALRELSVGGHWALVGRKGEMAAGNGAAVRIAPLAFVLDLATPAARQVLRDVARITHHSDEAYVGALALALAIRDALDHEWRGRDALFASLLDTLPDTRVRDRLALLRGASSPIVEVAAEHGTSGYVVDAVPLAIHAYAWAAESGDFASMVRQLVEAGGDCDSIASMAAQCLGAARGEAALPATVVARLPAIVGDTADRLAQSLAS